ncbi:MAG: 3-phosphoglycerate dehydrogenase [Candidatus Lokiarchaeota archaeon]|nr:3-phosphoglycerate dehydrogenase [Candidatus Lokiarchaeota archaeon]MBD3198686.1 3-phosphoglycerate dehydrogenase [Candidatus Lokiarchaeota archaeon]
MKILISDKIHQDGIKIMEREGFKVVQKYSLTPDQLKDEIHQYDGIIVRSGTKLNSSVLENAPNLKVIGRAGVGLDNIDLQKAEELEIKVFNTPEAPSVSVAELTIGLLLNLVRHISKADRTMHCGEWCKGDFMGTTLKGKKIGLIGFGNIGKEVAKKVAAFEMKIGVYDVDEKAKEIAKTLGYTIFSSVDELIQNSQIISLHIPATVKTENTLNKRRFELMKENTYIINTARGDLVDEKALMEALQHGKIAGAALDVYKTEPLENMDLCNCERNLILTPHIGSQTIETQVNAAVKVVEKIAEYLLTRE